MRPALLLALLGACVSPAPPLDTAPVDTDLPADDTLVGVSVRPFDPTLTVGVSQPFTARAHYGDGREVDVVASVRWASDDPRVVAVATDGTVEAVSPGEASVIATYEGLSGKVTATVRAADDTPTAVSLRPDTLTIAPGERAQLEAVATFGDGRTGQIGATCAWSSEHPERVAVDARGEITGDETGRSEIRAECGELPTATASVTVSDEPADRPLPDLALADFDVEVTGATATWTVAIENTGAGYAQGFWIDLFLDLAQAPTTSDDLLDLGWAPGLGAGDTLTLTFTTRDLATGVHASWVAVDLDDRVPETSESNNVAGPRDVEISGLAARPDLEITAFSGLADPDFALYAIEVTNTGDADATGFWIDLLTDAPSDPVLDDVGDDFTWVEALAPGASHTWEPTLDFGPAAGTSWSSTVYVDITARVDESDETNNLERTTVTAE